MHSFINQGSMRKFSRPSRSPQSHKLMTRLMTDKTLMPRPVLTCAATQKTCSLLQHIRTRLSPGVTPHPAQNVRQDCSAVIIGVRAIAPIVFDAIAGAGCVGTVGLAVREFQR